MMKEIQLFKTEMMLDDSADQSHITFRVYVPERVEKLQVDLSYDPPTEDRSEQLEQFLEEHSDYYDFHVIHNPKAAEKVFPLHNLLTLTVHDPNGFRGSCHRFRPEQTVVIANEHSTPGMNDGEIESGMWDVTINCHALISQSCRLRVDVKAFSEKDVNSRWYHKPFVQSDFPLRQMKQKENDQQPKEWIKAEIHCHTNHSDGSQTIEQLIKKAEQLNIDCVAITDHNTMSALEEWERLNIDTTVKVLKGIEWTTFHGHLLTLGYEKMTRLNWGHASPLTLKDHIAEIKREKAIAGVAHPFRPGSPFCTGCYFEYQLDDLDEIDFIEVWNGENPHLDKFNAKAFTMWTDLLNKGHQIAATAGRDWHHTDTDKQFASLYLHMPANYKEEEVKEAIAAGRSYISLAPKVQFRMNETYTIGDHVNKASLDELRLHVNLQDAEEAYTVVIDSNIGRLDEKVGTEAEVVLSTFANVTYVRALVYAKSGHLVAFTNPIYLSEHEQ